MAYPHKELTVRLSHVEQFAAWLCIIWGSWLVIFGERVIGTSQVFDVLLQRLQVVDLGNLSSIQTLGVVSIVCGCLYSGAILINGRGLAWTPFVRMLGSLAGLFFFAYIAQGLSLSGTPSTGIPTYSVISLGFFLLFYLNLSRVWEAGRLIGRRLPWKT